MHILYMITIGDKEIQSNELAVRTRDNKISGFKKEEFIEKVIKEINEKL